VRGGEEEVRKEGACQGARGGGIRIEGWGGGGVGEWGAEDGGEWGGG